MQHDDSEGRFNYDLGHKYGGVTRRPAKRLIKNKGGKFRRREGRSGRQRWIKCILGCFRC